MLPAPSASFTLTPFRRLRSYLAFVAAALTPVLLGAETLLTLEDAIRFALDKNPQIKVDAFSRSIARADLLAARGQFDPALTFRRSYSEDGAPASSNPLVAQLIQTDDYSLALEGTTPWGMNYSLGGSATNQRGGFLGYQDNYATFGGITVTQPLLRGFGFGPNLLGVRIAKADRGIADWLFRQTVIDTVTQVAIAYSDVAYAQQQLRIAQRSRELAAGLLAENEKRFSVGSMSESDVTQARARTATRDEAILFSEQALRDAINYLRQLMGETAFSIEPENLLVNPPEIPDDLDIRPAEDLQLAYEQRPDFQAAKLGIVKRRATHLAERNQLLPQVDFVGSYGYSGLDRDFGVSRRMVANNDNRSYSAGVVVSIPLTFAEGRGRARSARLRLHQAEADLLLLEQEIAVGIARAAGQIETTRRRVAANRAAQDLAREALDAELKKLRAGTSNTFFVLQQQEEVSRAENNLYRALADQRRAVALYDRELGRTLEARQITVEQ
ncbi:MAG TPA: TolC family protein [Opitutus sp.]|nr:TolC family protein [Opitutus sp.]